MSWILDIIIIAIIALTVFNAYRKGFIKTLISAGAFLIAIILTAVFASPVANILKSTPLANSIKDGTEEKIIEILEENSFELNDLINGESEEFDRIADIAGITEEELNDWNEERTEERDEAIAELAEKISNPIVDTTASIVSVIVIYIIVQIGLSVGGFFLDKIAKLPFLRGVNKSFGIILGVIIALLRVILFCFIVKILVDIAEFTGGSFILDTDKTLLFKLFSKINLFAFFIK